MKKIKLIFSLLIIMLFAFSCKKEHIPASTTGTPEFYFKGTVNGVATDLNAGLNNYYMYSSYAQDSNNVYNFTGNIKETNSILNSIEIEINDYKVSAVNSNTNPDSSLSIGNYQYYIPGTSTISTTVYKVYFYANTSNGTPQTYQWNFGDGQTAILSTPNTTHTYTTAGNYTASLTVNFSGGCSSSSSNQINNNTSTSASVTPLKVAPTYSVDSLNPGILHFSPNPNKPVFACLWDFGDGSGQIDSISPQHNFPSAAIYTVSLFAIDAANHSDTAKINLNVAANGYVHCLTNFTDSISAITTTTITPNNIGLGDITIKWTDAQGITYTSNNNTAQPAGSYFTILSEEAYQNNTNGQPTRKLHVQFTCTLYSTGHTPIQIINADAVIAVAYK